MPRRSPVGWRSFSSWVKRVALRDPACALRQGARSARRWLSVFLLVSLAGCGRFAVRPNEKEHLADRTMRFDGDQQEIAAEEHVLESREGSAGGRGTGAGGCGCN